MGPLRLPLLLRSRSKEHKNIVKSFLKRKKKAKLYPWLPDGWKQSLCKAERDFRDLDPEQAERFWTQPVPWSASEMSESFTQVETRGMGNLERCRRIPFSSLPMQSWELGLSPNAGRRSTRDPV